MKVTKAERQECLDRLRKMLPPGSRVHTTMRHVSRSGMSRDIDCYLLHDGQAQWLSRLIAKACDFSFNEKREAIRVQGCGMDMGYHIVNNLAMALYPEGFECTGRDEHPNMCPSNDHSNGDRNYKPHHHVSLGYALHHSWI